MTGYRHNHEPPAGFSGHDQVIQQLAAQSEITDSDLRALDRIARFHVVMELWDRCTPSAQLALLNERVTSVQGGTCGALLPAGDAASQLVEFGTCHA